MVDEPTRLSELIEPTDEERLRTKPQTKPDEPLERLTKEEFIRRHGSASDKLGLFYQRHKKTIGRLSAEYSIPTAMVGFLLLAWTSDIKHPNRERSGYRLEKEPSYLSARVVGNELRILDDGKTVTLVKEGDEYITPREERRREIEKYGAVMTARP